MRTRIKFCGITRLADAMAAVELGVDALGFVFYAKSPRHIEPHRVRAIIAALPPLVTTVGLFVDAEPAEVRRVSEVTRIDFVQFHGEETPDECRSVARPYIKAIKVRHDNDVTEAAARYADARALLLDTYDSQLPGGTGCSFDWRQVPAVRSLPLILAGGLSSDNVADAIRQVRPFAVDVSGGIEASKGIKDIDKMRAFLSEVKRIDCDTN